MKQGYSPSNQLESLRRLLGIRGTVLLGAFFLLAIVLQVTDWPKDAFRLLAVANFGCVIVNYGFLLALRYRPTPSVVSVVRQLQMPFDVLFCTVAIYLSGGVLTPVFVAFILVILASMILLDPAGVYRTATVSMIMYCALAFLEARHIIPYVAVTWGGIDLHSQATSMTYSVYVVTVCAVTAVAAYMANRIGVMIRQRNEQIERQLTDLRTLYDIANGLGSILEEDRMLRFLASTLQSMQNATHCLVGKFGEDGQIEFKAVAGATPEQMSHLARLRSDLPEFADLVRRGEPVIVEDIEKHPRFKAMRIFPSTRSFYVFPIVLEGQALGAISLSFDKVRHLNPDHADMLKTITSQVAVAIQRAQLLRDSQRLALEMTTLYDVGLRTGSTLSPSEVLRRTAASIEKLLNPDTYYIALYDPSDKSISFEVFVESGRPMPITRATLAEGGLTGRIVKTRKPLLVQDWQKDGTQYNAPAGNIGTDMLSYLGVPMLVEDRVLGVISVQSARPAAFTAQDERLLSALAAQTAMAYENARLHERAQEQAHLDSLTEVYNHGYFVELVRRATTLASRDGSQVALIMLDIDFFKSYNDQYGHVAGDNVLKLVAQAIKANVKATDSVGRWGGEEFGVLLPSAGAEEAQRVAARIRKAVLRLTPTDGSGNPIPGPTISQGISAFPDPSVSADSLIEQADAALYHAKFHGRDRLIIFEPGGGMAHVFPQALQTGELV